MCFMIKKITSWSNYPSIHYIKLYYNVFKFRDLAVLPEQYIINKRFFFSNLKFKSAIYTKKTLRVRFHSSSFSVNQPTQSYKYKVPENQCRFVRVFFCFRCSPTYWLTASSLIGGWLRTPSEKLCVNTLRYVIFGDLETGSSTLATVSDNIILVQVSFTIFRGWEIHLIGLKLQQNWSFRI